MPLRLAVAVTLFLAPAALAEMPDQRDGWAIARSGKSYDALVSAVTEAAGANGLGVVTQAGPTGAAASRGITIPGNRVIGLFNNVYAVRILNLSTPAMIEAPIRMYVTENDDGTATLSYKMPSHVFEPYFDGADPDLRAAAEELDAIFAAVFETALAAP